MCPNCGGEIRLIAFITERSSIQQILTHIGEVPKAPPIAPARAPPGPTADAAPHPAWEIGVEPIPDIEFDQRDNW